MRRGKLPVGWYVSGVGEDLQLGDEDLAVHREVFPEPWQVVLVHDASRGPETAAFLRFEAMTDRSYAAPFFEELPDVERGGANVVERRSTVAWINYRSDQETVRPEESTESLGLTVERKSIRPVSRIRTWFEFFRRSTPPAAQAPAVEQSLVRPTIAERGKPQPQPRPERPAGSNPRETNLAVAATTHALSISSVACESSHSASQY